MDTSQISHRDVSHILCLLDQGKVNSKFKCFKQTVDLPYKNLQMDFFFSTNIKDTRSIFIKYKDYLLRGCKRKV